MNDNNAAAYLHIKVDAELKEKAEELAKAQGMNLSSFIRFTLIKLIKENDKREG